MNSKAENINSSLGWIINIITEIAMVFNYAVKWLMRSYNAHLYSHSFFDETLFLNEYMTPPISKKLNVSIWMILLSKG